MNPRLPDALGRRGIGDQGIGLNNHIRNVREILMGGLYLSSRHVQCQWRSKLQRGPRTIRCSVSGEKKSSGCSLPALVDYQR